MKNYFRSSATKGRATRIINGLVNSFLTENPITIKNEILDEWEDKDVPDRLLFDTPIPLAEEQRKIIAALNKKDGRFVTVRDHQAPVNHIQFRQLLLAQFSEDNRYLCCLTKKKLSMLWRISSMKHCRKLDRLTTL